MDWRDTKEPSNPGSFSMEGPFHVILAIIWSPLQPFQWKMTASQECLSVVLLWPMRLLQIAAPSQNHFLTLQASVCCWANMDAFSLDCGWGKFTHDHSTQLYVGTQETLVNLVPSNSTERQLATMPVLFSPTLMLHRTHWPFLPQASLSDWWRTVLLCRYSTTGSFECSSQHSVWLLEPLLTGNLSLDISNLPGSFQWDAWYRVQCSKRMGQQFPMGKK